MYSWDSNKAKKGIEEPVKKNDHAVDALRYAIFTAFGEKKHLKWNESSDDGRTLGGAYRRRF